MEQQDSRTIEFEGWRFIRLESGMRIQVLNPNATGDDAPLYEITIHAREWARITNL